MGKLNLLIHSNFNVLVLYFLVSISSLSLLDYVDLSLTKFEYLLCTVNLLLV